MEKLQISLQTRTEFGKAVKKLRREGFVPGVVYGQDSEAQSVSVLLTDIAKVYKHVGKRQPVELLIGNEPRLAMIKEIDFDPVKHQLRHVAFHAIKQNEVVTTDVPLVILGAGETPAEKAGLIILTALDALEVEAKPNDLPEYLEVPGNLLAAEGDKVTVAAIVAPKGVTIMADPDLAVATVYAPSALQAANEAAAGESELESKPQSDNGSDQEAKDTEA